MPLRDTALGILDAALAAVAPQSAMASLFARERGPVHVFGAGKAAASMALGVEQTLGDRVIGGVVVTKDGHSLPLSRIRVLEASHPVPDARSLSAGDHMVAAMAALPADAAVVFVLSGGASALLERLAPDVSLQDLQQLTDALLRSGANIQDVNTVRKHVSRLKGGHLARSFSARPGLVPILSDVVGAGVEAVGSGPLLPDPTTRDEAAAILRRCGLPSWESRLLETPKSDDICFRGIETVCIGDSVHLVSAAAEEARARGYATQVLSSVLQGEARDVGMVMAGIAQEIRLRNRPMAPPCCLLAAGETTVTVSGSGQGGRNQEMALAAAIALSGVPEVVFLAAASDGTDGPTDAAGAWADGDTVARGQAVGLDARDYLRRHDSYRYFDALGDLLRLGPTRTNVNDLYLLLAG